MKLYFMRHGKAEEGVDIEDHDRQLTDQGLETALAAGRVLAAMQITPAHIYSSPRARARQTAEAVAQGLNLAIDIRDEVNFNFNIQAMWTLTQHLTDEQEVIFVGHNPTITEVVNFLTGARLMMKPGSIARVDVPRNQSNDGILAWLLPPKVFRVLGS